MNKIYKIFHPEIFQGSLKKRRYFEGTYFKHISAGTEEAFAVIPGVSLSDDSHAFIQFADSTDKITAYFRYNLKEFRYSRSRFILHIGDSMFSSEGIELKLKDNDHFIEAKLEYSDIQRFHNSILAPGIMGWYSYVPGMECNHGVISIGHNIEGSISINGKKKDFTGGKGYIEKDWGISFPESWIWLQCSNFSNEDLSVMISIAKIPWKGSFFIGFIAYISNKGTTELFATYNGARIISLKRVSESETRIVLRRKNKTLTAIITKKESATLKAPSNGLMISNIKESLQSLVTIEYTDGNKISFSDSGVRAGYEEVEKIFSYF
jgi:tocopherol cyclase